MKHNLLLNSVLVLLCFSHERSRAPRHRVRVRDGQTLVVIAANGQKLNIVLKGVDAPELEQEFGDVAREHLAKLVLNKAVELNLAR